MSGFHITTGESTIQGLVKVSVTVGDRKGVWFVALGGHAARCGRAGGEPGFGAGRLPATRGFD